MVHKEAEIDKSDEIIIDPNVIKKVKKYISRNKLSYDSASQIFRKDILDKVFAEKKSVPIEIFTKELGAFEAIVRYLKENLYLEFSEISLLTDRNIKTIWTAYKKSKTKRQEKFNITARTFDIPIEIFKNRDLGVQENLVAYLKDKIGMSYHDIASALKRDDRTIWTSYNRAKKKLQSRSQSKNIQEKNQSKND